ncbi:hypothetical protein NDU88_002010 [Pleurodeles waltl]|uniref:Uncharacterized protein n=1 Tax=Pleurodeles waltl TaxID=8319 RepID=A0AAV7REL8_PLEWA|nr:hypothetical protein NDU88_002010 [Pleurodeles waltl]
MKASQETESSRLARDSLSTERAWLEGRSRVIGEPRMVRLQRLRNGLMSRGSCEQLLTRGLEQHMGLVETQATVSRDRDQDLLGLRSKLTDTEDRSRRDNIRLHGILENEEGVDMQAFLSSTLPKLTSLDFDPPDRIPTGTQNRTKTLRQSFKTPINHRMLATA